MRDVFQLVEHALELRRNLRDLLPDRCHGLLHARWYGAGGDVGIDLGLCVADGGTAEADAAELPGLSKPGHLALGQVKLARYFGCVE